MRFMAAFALLVAASPSTASSLNIECFESEEQSQVFMTVTPYTRAGYSVKFLGANTGDNFNDSDVQEITWRKGGEDLGTILKINSPDAENMVRIYLDSQGQLQKVKYINSNGEKYWPTCREI